MALVQWQVAQRCQGKFSGSLGLFPPSLKVAAAAPSILSTVQIGERGKGTLLVSYDCCNGLPQT